MTMNETTRTPADEIINTTGIYCFVIMGIWTIYALNYYVRRDITPSTQGLREFCHSTVTFFQSEDQEELDSIESPILNL